MYPPGPQTGQNPHYDDAYGRSSYGSGQMPYSTMPTGTNGATHPHSSQAHPNNPPPTDQFASMQINQPYSSSQQYQQPLQPAKDSHSSNLQLNQHHAQSYASSQPLGSGQMQASAQQANYSHPTGPPMPPMPSSMPVPQQSYPEYAGQGTSAPSVPASQPGYPGYAGQGTSAPSVPASQPGYPGYAGQGTSVPPMPVSQPSYPGYAGQANSPPYMPVSQPSYPGYAGQGTSTPPVPASQPSYPGYAGQPNLPPSNQPHGQYPPAPPGLGHGQPPASAPGPMGPPQPKMTNSQYLPSVVEVIESNRALHASGPFGTGQRGIAPPLVTTNFSCRDEGNCNPRFIRSSLYAVPTTNDLLKSNGVPLTVTLSPFASLHPDDQPVVLGDMGAIGPIRCTRCRAYMNSFMSFVDGGRRFHCPLCDSTSEVPTDYFAHLDHTGRRTDAYHRPELCLGSYELTATVEYCTNGELPNPPAYLFILDVSQSAVRSGLVDIFCSQFVHRILPNLPRDEYDPDPQSPSPLRIGFITYDHQVQFYSLKTIKAPKSANNGLDPSAMNDSQNPERIVAVKPHVSVVADVGDIFVPQVDGFLSPPDPELIMPLLRLIPTQYTSDAATDGHQPPQQPADSLLGPAIQAGLEALRAAKRPGKLFVFHTNLPTAEAPGKLANREDRKLIGTEKEKILLTPSGNFYTTLGQNCVESGCSVDLFLFPTSFVDVATICEVPRLSGGNMYKYNCFQADLQGFQFLKDLERAVSLPKAFNTVVRLRSSPGIRPVEFFGNFHLPNTTDMEIACIGTDQSFTIELRHDDKLPDNDAIFLQAACLYTSLSGQRRLRVHNLSLSTTSSMAEVFRLADLDAHINWMIKHAVRSLTTKHYPQLVDELNLRTASTLAAYRRQCSNTADASGAHPGELILPHNMKLFPLYVQCLIKSDAFQPADHLSVDDKVLQIFHVMAMDAKQSCTYLYPRLHPVQNLELTPEGSVVYPPPAIRCSFEWLQQENAYLLDNGAHLILWLGSNLPSDWIQDVFNAPSSKHFLPEKIYDLVNYDNTTSRNLCILLDKIRNEHTHFTRLTVVRAGDGSESAFRRYLVEDRFSGNSTSYIDYLCHIHKEVTNMLR